MDVSTEGEGAAPADPAVAWRWLNDRARLRVAGPDCKAFLHGMVTNDVKGLAPGGGCHAAMLTVKGKLLSDLWIYDIRDLRGADGAESLLLQMEGAVGGKILAALEHHLIMEDATLADESAQLAQLGLYVAGAADPIARALGLTTAELPTVPGAHRLVPGEGDPVRVAATRELGRPGYHLFGAPAALSAVLSRLPGAQPLDEATAELWRIEAGVPRYGLDMDEERLPVEAGLDDAVSFKKGCYLGQEVIARVSARGHVNRRLLGLSFPDGAPPPPPGTPLQHETRPAAGTVMSGAVSPRHGSIALGYVHRTLWEPGTTLLVADAAAGAGQAANAARTAIVRALPFAATSG